MQKIILVNNQDEVIGFEEKLKCHQLGLLHRAFSIFIFDENNESVLLQKRSGEKYHFPNLWSNTCCSHPVLSLKEIQSEAESRLLFEMGINCSLLFLSKIQYFAKCEKTDLFEHEIDYIFKGFFPKDDKINYNINEVSDVSWVKKSELLDLIRFSPEKYTPWLKIIIETSEVLK